VIDQTDFAEKVLSSERLCVNALAEIQFLVAQNLDLFVRLSAVNELFLKFSNVCYKSAVVVA